MVDEPRKKRTITEIRESKKTGEKMVYTSVPDYTAAQWAEMAGVDVAVLGDSLAMIGRWVLLRTLSMTAAAVCGWLAKLSPPASTLGQEILISIASIGESSNRRVTFAYSSTVDPQTLAKKRVSV